MPTNANVLGILSLIFWALILVVSTKYMMFITRANNNGEGGMLALVALLNPWRKDAGRYSHLLLRLGVFGAALLYGSFMLTPAISVSSAVDGLNVTTSTFKPYVIPITIVILIGLFSIQSRGTGAVGVVFGPIMIVWFVCLGLLGVYGISHEPSVLGAVNPVHAVDFFIRNRWIGFAVLGAVFLVLTVRTEDVPRIPAADRLEITDLGQGVYRIFARYGFMQNPNVPVAVRLCEHFGIDVDMDETTFYIGRATIIPSDKLPGMMLWRDKLFALMSRNAIQPTSFYNVPPERVIELGLRVEI